VTFAVPAIQTPNGQSFRAGRDLMEGHQFPGVRIVQWLQQYAIHNTEDGRVCADSDRDGAQGDNSKDRIMAQRAQPMADVGEKVFHGWPPPHFTAALLDQRKISEFPPCGVHRLFPGHSVRNQFINFLGKMRAHLF